MNLKRLKLTILEKLCRFTHNDPMEYKLAKYRMSGAEIGTNVRAFSPITSSESYLIIVGNDVTISTGVKFCTHDNSVIKILDDATDLVGPIIIGDHSFIGMNAIIMGGGDTSGAMYSWGGECCDKEFFSERLCYSR